MKEPEILITGTYTNDLESGRRMQWLLDKFEPDIIIGETNQLFDEKASTREMIWAILFDECEIPVDVQEKWKAIQTHKEHLAAYSYSTRKRIPYFMVDAPTDPNPREVALYSQTELVEELKVYLELEEIQNHVREMVEKKFNQHQEAQNGDPYCEKYYTDKFMCERHKPAFAEARGKMLALEVQSIMERYKSARIFGFFNGTQIVRPDTIWVTQRSGRPMHNLRYHLGEHGIQYGQLVDLI